jgi:nucleoside diphosphate kinase
MIKPLAMNPENEVWVREWINDNGGTITEEWRGLADAQRISAHYGSAANQPYFPSLLRYFQGKQVLSLRIELPDAKLIGAMRDQIGSSSIDYGSLRAKLMQGKDWQHTMVRKITASTYPTQLRRGRMK